MRKGVIKPQKVLDVFYRPDRENKIQKEQQKNRSGSSYAFILCIFIRTVSF